MICGALRQIQDTNSLGAVSRPATARHCRLVLSLSLSLSLALFFFLLRSLSFFLPLFCFSPELLSCLISVCIMLQLSQLTRCSSSRRSTLWSSLLPPPRATVRGIDLEKTRIMRDNASKLYIHGSGSMMLAASTIRVAITNFIDTSVLAFSSFSSSSSRSILFFFSFCLSVFSYSRLISVYILFQLRRIDVPLVASLSISVCCSESPEVADNWWSVEMLHM